MCLPNPRDSFVCPASPGVLHALPICILRHQPRLPQCLEEHTLRMAISAASRKIHWIAVLYTDTEQHSFSASTLVQLCYGKGLHLDGFGLGWLRSKSQVTPADVHDLHSNIALLVSTEVQCPQFCKCNAAEFI